jgi:hypothetical protein
MNCHPHTLVFAVVAHTTADDRFSGNLFQYRWTLSADGYAVRSEKRKTIFMQNEVWRLDGRPKTKLDHEDNDPLNNQLSNLRPATFSQNAANRKLAVNSTTGYKGVSWNKPWGKYTAYIRIKGRQTYLGAFADPIEAARIWDQAALKYHGEFALTNKALGLIP